MTTTRNRAVNLFCCPADRPSGNWVRYRICIFNLLHAPRTQRQVIIVARTDRTGDCDRTVLISTLSQRLQPIKRPLTIKIPNRRHDGEHRHGQGNGLEGFGALINSNQVKPLGDQERKLLSLEQHRRSETSIEKRPFSKLYQVRLDFNPPN